MQIERGKSRNAVSITLSPKPYARDKRARNLRFFDSRTQHRGAPRLAAPCPSRVGVMCGRGLHLLLLRVACWCLTQAPSKKVAYSTTRPKLDGLHATMPRAGLQCAASRALRPAGRCPGCGALRMRNRGGGGDARSPRVARHFCLSNQCHRAAHTHTSATRGTRRQRRSDT